MRHLHVLSILTLSASAAVAATGPRGGIDAEPLSVPLAVEPVEAIRGSMLLGHADPGRHLSVTISFPFADPEGMQRFADSVSDPNSPNYGQFITPDEVGARFGLPLARIQAVADHMASHGLDITFTARHRLAITCEGTVEKFEKAFKTTIDAYAVDVMLAPDALVGGNAEFIAPSAPLQLPADIAPDVLDVSGLETYTRPMPRMALTPTQTRGLYGGAPIYGGSPTMRGEGRTIAISSFDGYRLTNVPLYISYYGLPTPAGGANSNIHEVKIGGGLGTGTAQGEADLDIQMVIGMAPLCQFYIYDSNNDLNGCLAREVSDNLADVISESYGWSLSATTYNAAHNNHLSMTAQGITYMCASGDSGTTLTPYTYPDYDPEVLMVGGSVAVVNGSNARTSEVGWSGSGGGWVVNTASFNKLPSWQKGTGVPTTVNYRLVPDLALHANGGTTGAYPYYFNGGRTTAYSGTSFSSPVFAGLLGIGQQKLISLGGLPANGAGKSRMGRIQDVIYAQNGRSDVWYDITSGSNGTLLSAVNGSTSSTAHAGWDFVTGWGAINMDAFIATQAPVACFGDLDGNNEVNGADLSLLLLDFGPCSGCDSDLDGDGIVTGGDISLMLLSFGPC